MSCCRERLGLKALAVAVAAPPPPSLLCVSREGEVGGKGAVVLHRWPPLLLMHVAAGAAPASCYRRRCYWPRLQYTG